MILGSLNAILGSISAQLGSVFSSGSPAAVAAYVTAEEFHIASASPLYFMADGPLFFTALLT